MDNDIQSIIVFLFAVIAMGLLVAGFRSFGRQRRRADEATDGFWLEDGSSSNHHHHHHHHHDSLSDHGHGDAGGHHGGFDGGGHGGFDGGGHH